MKQYLDLLRHVYENGVDKADRTGVGTRSVFGAQMRFNLADGFPLVTTKKMFTQGMIDEVIWFISGSTNVNDLPERTQHWWSPWADEDGNLGSIYGEQYRSARWFTYTTERVFTPPTVEKKAGLLAGVGNLGNLKRKQYDRPSQLEQMLKKTWTGMINRCYQPSSSRYKFYGAKGVHVSNDWLNFEVFFEDVQKLQGWELKKHFPNDYSLDKDILFASNIYSKETCIWASDREQIINTAVMRPIIGISPEGESYTFPSQGDISRITGINRSHVRQYIDGRVKTCKGWHFEDTKVEEGKILRFRELDQLKYLIANIKEYPNSRRLVINLWNTPAMQNTRLHCCHGSVIQCDVENGKLSMQVYQRSADIFIGLPVNLASYSLLLMMIAQVCGLEAGELVYTLGNAHIYKNHFEQVETQLAREPLPLPKMILNKNIDNIFDFTYNDFELVHYQHHAIIKAPVAV